LKEGDFINYFFEIVIPQLLEYFKENAKVIPSFFLLEVLLKNKNSEKDIQKLKSLCKSRGG